MRLPLRRISSSLVSARFACGFGMAVALVTGAQAQIQVPIPQILGEVEQDIKARKLAEAVDLLDRVLARADKGEAMPAGVSLDAIQLLAANTHFQLRNYPRAEEIATALLKRVKTGQIAADGRLVLGLSLALQNKFAEAIPVFQALEESTVYREKALMYRSMAAQQAKKYDVAIEALNSLLATAPRDADWADSALTLIALQLEQKNFDAARRGLELLRGSLNTVDNLAGLNVLSLALGDALLTNDPAGALTAYRTVLPRAELLRLQRQRTARMEAALTRQKQLSRNSVTDADGVRRVEARIKATKDALEEISKKADYDSTLYYRLGHTFLIRGGAWEAAIIFERLLKEFPEAEEREQTYLELVRAYSDSARIDKMKTALDRFIKATPDSKLLPQALYIGAQAAFDRGRSDMQLQFLEIGVTRFPDAELSEFMVLMQANAHFAAGRFEEARVAADSYVTKYPSGRFAEDAVYLRGMAALVLGNSADAIKEINAYLAKYPEGRFVADGRYRIAAAQYSLQDYAAAEKQLEAWLTDFPTDHPQRAEALSTQGDVFAGENRIDDAIVSYRAALSLNPPDEQLGYILDELTKHYQAKRDYNTAAVMWEEFAREHPDHPFVINAAYWIGRLRAREGKSEEALTQMGEIARRYVTDPNRDAVERLLTQMAALLSRNPKAGPDGKRPPAPTAEEIAARIEKELVTPQTQNQPTVKARVLFTEAEVASLRKNPVLRDQLLARIGDEISPEALPPGLLGRVGDLMREQGKLDRARGCYDQLVLKFPRSMYADFGYVGLGELAYIAGDYDTALIHFTNAIDRAGARFKLLEATLGRAKTLLAKGDLDQSKELFEQIASNRAWRGEATAQSVYSLGEISLKRGTQEDLAKAQAQFQRVFISYRKFTTWVARAYLAGGQTFEKLGKPAEALNTYREMLRDVRLVNFPERARAKERADILEAQYPNTPLLPAAGGPPIAAPATVAPAAAPAATTPAPGGAS